MKNLFRAGSRKVITVDLDDVLFPFSQGFVEFHNQHHLTNVKYDDWYTWDMHEVFGCDKETMTERVHTFFSSPSHEAQRPLAGAIEAINELSGKYNLEIVTSRLEHTTEKVLRWIGVHFPDSFKQVHFTNNFGGGLGNKTRKKSEVCRELGSILHIEDALSHASDVVASGIPVLLPDRPWNQGEVPAGVHRLHSWDEVLEWVKKNF